MNAARSVFQWTLRFILLSVLFIVTFVIGSLAVVGVVPDMAMSEPGTRAADKRPAGHCARQCVRYHRPDPGLALERLEAGMEPGVGVLRCGHSAYADRDVVLPVVDFKPCAPFAGYREDPNSVCMSLEVGASEASM